MLPLTTPQYLARQCFSTLSTQSTRYLKLVSTRCSRDYPFPITPNNGLGRFHILICFSREVTLARFGRDQEQECFVCGVYAVLLFGFVDFVHSVGFSHHPLEAVGTVSQIRCELGGEQENQFVGAVAYTTFTQIDMWPPTMSSVCCMAGTNTLSVLEFCVRACRADERTAFRSLFLCYWIAWGTN